ncbi:MAG: DUF2895 family protein [Cardiobacteriaceae bacterium]|nr:DUF2895 family protein [Cardiobacteriaceae bacterium]
MKAKKSAKEGERDIRFLHRCIIALIVVNVLLAVALWRLPKQMTVFIPPDVTRAFIQKADEIPPHAVYGFARTLWENLNYCNDDCANEYPEKLHQYQNYLSKSCQQELQIHFERNRSLYSYRSRVLVPTENAMYSPDSMQQLSTDTWLVKLEYILKDNVNGSLTRDNRVMYPLRVIKSYRPVDVNPLGLEVDCYFDKGPQTIEQYEIKEEKN